MMGQKDEETAEGHPFAGLGKYLLSYPCPIISKHKGSTSTVGLK